ncbi:MAG: alpha/beta fold hydrolase [Candidatus Sericytochromatia bacterium]
MNNILKTIQEQIKIRTKYGFEFIGDIDNIKTGFTERKLVFNERYHKLYFYPSKAEKPEPILLIYSLINKPYIFDLAKGRSLIEYLCDNGFDVYLLDWGQPTNEAAFLTLEEMIFGTMHRAVKYVNRKYNKKVNLLGYCMGSTFATIYVGKHHNLINSLVLLTPALGKDEGGTLQKIASFIDWNRKTDSSGIISGRFLKLFFNSVKPSAMIKKERDFWKNHDKEEYLNHFLPVEKWSNDTPDIPGKVFTEFLELCFTQDLLKSKNDINIGSTTINFSDVKLPVFSVSAKHDWIIPSTSVETVKEILPNSIHESFIIQGGHIGLVIGKTAPILWEKVRDFYNNFIK